MKTKISKNPITIYKGGNVEIDVTVDKETVWLSLNQMAELFQRDKSVVSRHIQNVYKEKELTKNSTVANFATVQNEGGRRIERKIEKYNLDVIISVGYRIKSNNGTKFRIWATKTIKDYLIQGYAINQKRLTKKTEKLNELQKIVSFIQDKASNPELQDQAQELLKIINEYSNSLTLLHQYDEGKLSIGKGKKPSFVLTHEDTEELIKKLKSKLIKKGEAGGLFGQDVSGKLEGIIGAIYQTFDKQELY